MMDIDATPTRGWDDGKGFNPIGTLDLDLDDGDDSEKFTGKFDGDDNVVRGLRIVRDAESNGLFGFVSGGVVENLGLDDVFVFGETSVRHSGALVGIMLGGEVRESWARGGVYGRLAVGGLVGAPLDHLRSATKPQMFPRVGLRVGLPCAEASTIICVSRAAWWAAPMSLR